MKTIKRIFLFIFVIALATFLFANTNTNVKATPLNTSNKLVVEGAAIRTTGHAGMKFAANVGDYDTTNVTAYGIAIAYGSVSAGDDFKVGGTINERDVLSTTVDELDNEGKFHIVLWNIPEESYIQDVTARAFVIDNGEYVYGETVAVRNIYQVANAAKDDVGYVTNDYIESIVAAFHTVTYHYNGSIVGYASFAELVADFVSDFNATTGNHITAAGLYSAGSTAHATFFNNDAMNAKWSWLIDSLENLRQHGFGNHANSTAAYAHAKAKTLDQSNRDDLGPIRENVQGFMTKTKCEEYSRYCAIDFSSGDVQELMFELLTDEKLAQNGGALVANPTRDGYTFAGWYDNQSLTGSALENVGENTDLYAKWNLNTYNVTFMDGESVLALSPSTYNIKQHIDLPEYEKPGFTFDGWYDNPSFTGSAKTEINAGTFGDLIFYAKTTEITGYTINFNFNGGNTYYEDIDAVIADYLRDYNTYNNKSYTTATYPNIDKWEEADKTVNFFYANLSKWGWLVDFFATNASAKNKPAYGVFRNYNDLTELNAANSDYRYEVAYEPRGLVGKKTYTLNKYYHTNDWSVYNNQALVMAWLSNISQTEYLNNNGTVALSTLVPNVYKYGYTFGGWYDNSEFTGDAVTSVTEATTLYAKWNLNSYNVTFMDGESVLALSPSTYNINQQINLPEYDKDGFIFDGWYDNPSFTGDAKTAINVGTSGNLVFYAKTTEITGYTVNFNFNGGNTYYEDIDAVIADYLADYNSYNNRSYTTATYPNIDKWDEADKTVNFFYANLSKWGWLVDFFATNGSTQNKPGYVAFRNYNNYDELNTANSNYKYEIAYETRGLVGKMLWNTNENYPTTDWSNVDNQALVMAWLSNISQTEYLNINGTVALSTLIPHVYKQGYTFGGWYDNPSFTGDAVTSVTGATTLYAKWIAN